MTPQEQVEKFGIVATINGKEIEDARRKEKLEQMRFTAACHAMQGILACPNRSMGTAESTAKISKAFASALLKELGYE